jgi:ribose transport system permease protein
MTSLEAGQPKTGLVRKLTYGVRLSNLRAYAIVFTCAVLFVTLSLSSSSFFTTTNVLNILDQSSALGIIACGGTVVFIAGGFDLSVGAVFGMAGVISAMLEPQLGVAGSLIMGLLLGIGIGILNGLVVTVGRINAFMATIGTNFVFMGLALVMTGGSLISVVDPSYALLGRGAFIGVKYDIWVWAAFAVLLTVLLELTTFGRYVFASGGNPQAARLSGIRVNLVRTIAFAISGFSASLGGIIVSSRVSTGQADSGSDIMLTVIAAIVIGGTSIFGGEGAIWRAVLGILLLTLIGNGFDLLNVNPLYQQVLQGLIILFAVGLDAWTRKTA